MTYRIEIKPSAVSELEGLHAKDLKRVDAAILLLGVNPRHHGAIKLKDAELHRVRIGNRRIVYEINDRERLVTIVTIAHRSRVYRR